MYCKTALHSCCLILKITYMPLLHRESGYNFYFKKGEASLLGKKPHVHVYGQGLKIQYYLNENLDVKKRQPLNFPEREESKIYQIVKKKIKILFKKMRRIQKSRQITMFFD